MQLKYYKFDNHFDGVGVVPQHPTMGSDYDYDAPDSVHQLSFDSLPEFEPNFNSILLDDRAILTDLISSSPVKNCGWLVSGKLKAILDTFTLPLHQYFPVPVLHRGQKIPDYRWLQLPQAPVNIPPDAVYSDAEDLILACGALHDIALFCLYRPPRFVGCYVRQDLKNAIETAGITGGRFTTSRLFK
ncbi:MAG: hypothetical protein CME31_05240 [Gimesia sp.]|uniref:Uncharacterized protein n=1 Tax=Gimesia maris TaxID=122 RepID=A0A3D3RBB0_9PLAN|nr:hypothetical protein [Gimesia sp.]HCO25896.1 hypothetical protein [Gimesia maris]|tara:strand:- start:130366 stop:130926 length:561 start_codon:yes stop_codon:yes gene_type:complete